MDKIIDFYKERAERSTWAECITRAINENAEITAEYIGRLLDVINHQEERINRLYDALYAIAPDIEIIETLAETEEERQEMISRYMNHGEYTESR